MRVLWSAAVLAAAVFVYWRWVRPALHVRSELKAFYAQADGFWAELAARLAGYRTYITAIGGAVALEFADILPDLVGALAGADLTAFGVPPELAKRLGQILLLTAAVFRAKANVPAKQEDA